MQNNTGHAVILENRSTLKASGVKSIDSFTDTRIILNTVMGELVIKGTELKVTALSEEGGDFSVTGRIKGLYYNRFSSTDNLFGRLFH